MTWLSYFWYCHLWLDSISDLVSNNLSLLLLVLSSITGLSYFGFCHHWLYSLNYGTIIYVLILLFLAMSATIDPCHLWYCQPQLVFLLSGLVSTTWLYIPSGVLRTRSSFFWRASGSNSRDQITLLQVSLWIQQSSLLMSYLHCQAYCLATFTGKPTDGLPSLSKLLMGYLASQAYWMMVWFHWHVCMPTNFIKTEPDIL